MSSSEGSVGDVEVEQGSQVSREGGLDIQVAEDLHGGVKRVRRGQAPRLVASVASVTHNYLSNISQKFRSPRNSQRHLVTAT